MCRGCEPDINDHLRTLAAQETAAVVVSPTGFVSDHLEVRWDLDTEARETAAELGLPFARAATAGTHPAFVAMVRELVEEELSGAPRRALGSLGICGLNCPPRMLSAPGPAFAATSGGGQARVLSRTSRRTTPTAKIARPATMPVIGNVATSPAQPITPRICTGRGYRRSSPGWVNAARFAIR